MRALYSRVCHLRTLCALGRGMVTLTLDGWTALAPSQLLVLGCGLCIVLRTVIPSPRANDGRRVAFLDALVSVMAAVAVVLLTTAGILDVAWSLGAVVLRL